MGWNTVAVIYNDHIGDIEKREDTGLRLADAMRRWLGRPTDRLRGWFGVGQIIGQAHADVMQVCVVGQNTGWNLTNDDEVPEIALQAAVYALKRRGYKITKLA